MSETPELLPCPFCGGEMMFRKALWPSDGDTDSIIHKVPQGGPDGNCGSGDFSNGTSDGQIVTAWNSRAPDPRISALIEVVKKVETLLSARTNSLRDHTNSEKVALCNLRNALRAALTAMEE